MTTSCWPPPRGRMLISLLVLAAPLAAQTSRPTPPTAVDLANLRADVDGLRERVGELASRVETLERENQTLRQQSAAARDAYATMSDVNAAVTRMSDTLKAADAQVAADTLKQTRADLAELTRQTNASLDAMARSINSQRGPSAAPVFSDNFPKEGITYTVRKGDTVAAIAAATGAKVTDIINANKIADPTKIQVGQNLFIPGGKLPAAP